MLRECGVIEGRATPVHVLAVVGHVHLFETIFNKTQDGWYAGCPSLCIYSLVQKENRDILYQEQLC